jgi:hypothetical protein
MIALSSSVEKRYSSLVLASAWLIALWCRTGNKIWHFEVKEVYLFSKGIAKS